MNYRNNRLNKRGQILLITLFVLAIMAILMALTIRIVLVDTQQADANEDFDSLYNVSESITQDFVATATDVTIDDVISSCTGTAQKVNLFTAECEFTIDRDTLEPNPTNTGSTVDTKVTVQDQSIVEVDLQKDQAYSIELTAPLDDNSGFISFDDNIYVEWPGRDPIAVEIILTYFEDNSDPGNTRFVWDEETEDLRTVYGVFNYQMLSANPSNPFVINSSASNALTFFRFNIRSAIQSENSSPNAVPKSMVIIPRMNDDSREFTIRSYRASDHNSNNIYPIQLREITTQSFDRDDPDTPIAEVTTLVPKYPQLDSLFYYVLLSQEDIVIP